MSNTPLTIRLFGPLRVLVREAPLPRVRTRSVEWLLALLALRQGRAVNRSWLAGTLWPESEERQALQNLRNDLVALRKALGPESGRIQSSTRDMLTLDLEGADVDVVRFDRAIQAGDEVSLRQAVEVYTGPLLEGCYAEWALAERETRAAQCLEVLETLAERAAERADHAEAVRCLRQAEGFDPLRDSTARRLMASLAASGDPAAAVEVYRHFRNRLHEALATAPDEATTRLFHEIRARVRQTAGTQARPDLSLPAFPNAATDPTPNVQHPKPDTLVSGPPHPLTPLIGREQEVQALRERLAQSRLVTLVGAGGVGKTRLAMEVAALMAEAFDGGSVWVELAPLADGALLLPAIGAALGIREEDRAGPETLISRVAARLANGNWLLALDNCEHLLDSAATVVETLLQASPGLRVLVTSRQRLGLPGETVWRVPSLSTPEPAPFPDDSERAVERALGYPAVRLFVERAESARPGFRLRGGQETLAVARICHRLDGIPLAIELAAARVTVLPVEQIAARLDDRFQLLTGGSRAALPRHQTLRALIDWSYDGLPELEAALLRCLSVFAGGWTLEAAEAVCALTPPRSLRSRGNGARDGPGNWMGGEGWNVLDALDALEARSLVLTEETAQGLRYRMLETVREYAREKLYGCGEEATARAAHATYFLQLAETAEAAMSGPEQLPWLNVLEAEHANLRVALAWSLEASGNGEVGLRLAVAMQSLWVFRHYVDEGRQYLDLLLASPQAEGRTAARAAALRAAGALACLQNDFAVARARGDESLGIYEERGDRIGIARALSLLTLLTSDREQARQLAMQSLALFRECNDPYGTAFVLTRLSEIASAEQDRATARAFHREALSLARSIGDRTLEAGCLSGLATIEYERRDFAAARDYFQASLALARELGMHNQTAVSLYFLGLLAFRESDYATAQALWEECHEMDRRNRTKGGSVLGALAEVAALQGDTPSARAWWDESLADGRELGRPDLVARSLRGLGDVARLDGDSTGARTRYCESLLAVQAAARRPENKIAEERHEAECAACLRGIAAAFLPSGKEAQATRLLGAAEALAEAVGAPLPPAAQAGYRDQMAALRRNLGEEAFATAWAEGRALSLEQAIDYALNAAQARNVDTC